MIAGVLLILFAFSITPKKVLHDLVVDHADTIVSDHSEEFSHFHTTGFHCNLDNLVAESPFTAQHDHFEFIPVLSFPVQQEAFLYSYYADTCFFSELRGPPATV